MKLPSKLRAKQVEMEIYSVHAGKTSQQLEIWIAGYNRCWGDICEAVNGLVNALEILEKHGGAYSVGLQVDKKFIMDALAKYRSTVGE